MSRELTSWESLATELVVDHRSYRLRRETVRLPSGLLVDDYFVSERADAGEVPARAAARELLEETGYACAELRKLGRFEPDPTKNTNTIVAFLGQGAELAGEARWDEQEEIELLLLPIGELKAEIRAGRISAAGTVATIYRALEEP